MINYADIGLFEADVPKQLYIRFDNTTITNDDIVKGSVELTESLCSSKQLYVGACEASCFKFRIGEGFVPLHLKTITVSILPSGSNTELQIGVFKVYTDKLTADRRFRDIVAYDAMYRILNADVINWYNTVFPDLTTTYTLKQFRDSFFTHFGITQESTTLINDSMTVRRTIDAERLSGKDVISAICEANGCFGHIGRDGKFKYIYLAQMIETLYPAEDLYPSEDLFPSDGAGVTNVGDNGTYISAKYEDYQTAQITKLQIRQEEDDIGKIVGSGTNTYVIQGNFLFFGMSSTDLTPVANNLLAKLQLISYRPSEIEVVGNPCLEVGDGVQVVTKYTVINTYILQRTMHGIHALRDKYVSSGSELRTEEVNSVNSQIMALRGRSNKLTRSIEETVSELTRYEQDTDGTLTSYDTRITQNATAITSEATRASTAEGNLSSRITQTADAISAEVTRATGVEGDLSASIQINAQAITQKVSKGDVSSEITQESDTITLRSNRLIVDSDYFKLYSDGTGKLGGLTFDADGFYSVLNGSKVLRVIPNPTDYVLSLGAQNVTRLRLYPDVHLEGNNFDFEVDADGVMELTTLNVLDRYTGYSVTKQGTMHVDSFFSCYGNIECGTHDTTPSGIAGSIFAHFTPNHATSGCVNAENNIYASGTYGGTGDVQAAHDVIYGNSCYQGSDKRLKKEIKDLEGSEELIYSLKPKSFRYKRDDSQVHHGFVAQDIEKIVEEDSAIIHKDGEGIMSVGYIELIADLVKTVQMQNERIKALEEALLKEK